MLSITLLMAIVVQSRLLILGTHATAHRLSFASILLVPPLFFTHSQSHSRFIAIVLRALSSPCHHYRYPPRSTEPIPLVPHPVVLQTMSIYHCRYSPFVAATVISLSCYPLALVLSLLLSLATSTSQMTASKPRRSSAPREGVLS
jgi:hypothetical protein